MKIFTIGAYGFSEKSFFDAVIQADVAVFCDVRRRRGLRGKRYSFANSASLQNQLSKLGISYIHLLAFAPSSQIRELQKAHDAQHNVAKRQRMLLSRKFISAYKEECLDSFDRDKFIQSLGGPVQSMVLFCVETNPQACHRSVLASKLALELGASVEHLQP